MKATQIILATPLILALIPSQAQAQPGFVELSATQTTRRFDDSARLTVSEVKILAIRADGSRAEKRILRNGNPMEMRTIVDANSAERIVLDQWTQSRTTYPLSPAELAPYRNPPNSCTTGNQPRQTAAILGYEVVKDEIQSIPGQSSSQVIRWRAPALNCLPLRTELNEFLADGAPRASLVEEVTSIVPGTPDPSLFEIPSNYQVRTPQQVVEIISRQRR